MRTRGSRCRDAVALCGLLALVSLARPAGAGAAPDWEALRASAAGAADEAAVTKIAHDLEARLPDAAEERATDDLAAAARVFGELVARGQDLDLSPAALEGLVLLGGRLGERVEARRGALEARAGDDEAQLDALYRGESWRSLSGSAVEVSFWLGWAQLARVDRGLEDAPRTVALAAAEQAFTQSARALAFPDLAVRSLLGLGIARREQGDLEGARQSFERLLSQRAMRSDPALAGRVRYELALTATDALDVARGQQLAEELEKADALTPKQRLALEARQVRAWVRIARKESGDGAEEAGRQAASQLRDMLGRGGPDADVAASLVAQFAGDLAGRDLGTVGALLEADRAFQAEDCEKALAAYAVALGQPLPAQVDVPRARLRAAWCKGRTGHAEEAMKDLEALLAGGLVGDERVDAARLLQSLAESAYRSTQRKTDLARANRAARILLEAAPRGEGADLARYREAQSLSDQGRSDAALALLAQIPKESESYPAALTLRIRVEANALETLRGGVSNPADRRSAAVRAAATRLAGSLDEAAALRARGDLPPDAQQQATMAAMRCEAAWLAGEDLASVERRIAEARHREGLSEAARQELLGVEISALVGAQQIARVVALLAARDDETLARELPVWRERLAELEASPKAAAVLPDVCARLAKVAPKSAQGELRLAQIDALRRAGRSPEAVALARELTKDEPEWGDAWVALARSLEAAGDRDASLEVWRRVGGGASAGSVSWWEARLALYDAARAGSEPDKACGWLDAAKGMAPAPGLERRIEQARTRCAKPGV